MNEERAAIVAALKRWEEAAREEYAATADDFYRGGAEALRIARETIEQGKEASE